jgi:hypothetical protein
MDPQKNIPEMGGALKARDQISFTCLLLTRQLSTKFRVKRGTIGVPFCLLGINLCDVGSFPKERNYRQPLYNLTGSLGVTAPGTKDGPPIVNQSIS